MLNTKMQKLICMTIVETAIDQKSNKWQFKQSLFMESTFWQFGLHLG